MTPSISPAPQDGGLCPVRPVPAPTQHLQLQDPELQQLVLVSCILDLVS